MKPLIAVLLFLGASHVWAAGSIGACNEAASQMNANLPMQLDRVTRVLSVLCVGNGSRVTVVYNGEITSKKTLGQSDVNLLKQSQVRMWCTNPNQREILNDYDIQNNYFTPDKKFIGKIRISKTMCS